MRIGGNIIWATDFREETKTTTQGGGKGGGGGRVQTTEYLYYATAAVKKTTGAGGATVAENLNAIADTADIVVALDRLQAMAPSVESVSLVVVWFGDDLRAGNCKVRPGVEVAAKATTQSTWVVNGVSRADAFLVSRDAEDRPVYGGTPADFAVVQAIQEMKARGLRVTFYPFLLMDVPPGNCNRRT